MFKIACICQFRNADDYFSLFHNHHKDLFDKFLYIDHLSDRDYSHLKLKDSFFYRVNIRNFAKDLFVYAIFLRELALKDFDFLFILDIDEFLPFWNRLDFEEFLTSYRSVGVGTLLWRNGFPENFNNFTPSQPLYFMKRNTSTKKIFYNMNKINQIIPNEGNHNAKYPFLNQTYVQLRPKRLNNSAFMYHLPFISKSQISTKMNVFPASDFSDKIERIEVKDDGEHLFEYIANYRELRKNRYGKIDFEKINLFRFLKEDFSNLKDKIWRLPDANYKITHIDENSINLFRKKGFFKSNFVRKNLVFEDNIIYALSAYDYK